LLAKEAKARNAVCLLAPTINIQRSPLGGRAFESFSEDPTLSGHIAAAYVEGLQSENVSAAIKHFVANDQEHERMGEDSIIEQRALREIYLRPFQIAQKKSTPWAYMTSYNKLNGTHCSENEWLLQTVLRGEWKHDGLIMSDWYGTYSVSESINAGLNLEMPGAAIWRANGLVKHLVGAHKIEPRQIDKVAGEVLQWVQKLAKLNPDLVYAKPSPESTRSEDKAEDAKLVRKIGGESLVLLKNENNVLPVTSATPKVAVIGPNAKAKVITGGGSAQLRAAWAISPWDGLVDNKPEGVELTHAYGAITSKFLPLLGEDFTCLDGSAGFNLSHYAIVDGKRAEKPAVTSVRESSDMFMPDFAHPDLGAEWISEGEAILESEEDTEWEFGMCVTGQGWIYVDDKLVVDASNESKRSTVFFNCGSYEIKGTFKAEKGKVCLTEHQLGQGLTDRSTRSGWCTTRESPKLPSLPTRLSTRSVTELVLSLSRMETKRSRRPSNLPSNPTRPSWSLVSTPTGSPRATTDPTYRSRCARMISSQPSPLPTRRPLW